MKMKTTRFLTAMCVIALTGASFAGIKYWDNQAYKVYDVGDYVQDGLVLNYDGIRNAGPTADHDPDATTWKNLGSGGATYDMSIGGPATSSAWGADGFAFAGDAYFRSASKHTLSEYYEIQSLVDAKASDATGIGYVYSRIFADAWNKDDPAWNRSSIAVRPEFSQKVSGTTYKGSLVFNTHYYTDGRPLVPTSVATTFDYMTALGESTSAAIFIGLDVPTAMPGRASPKSEDAWAAQNPARVYIGGHEDAAGTGVGEALTGTVKNLRYYSRVLSADERAWNRVVDEARYFNRKVALPVTNVVVRSNCAPVYGDQPSGNYAVDALGFTFTATASKTYKGRNYTCAGYTLEIWNNSTGAWGEPEAHDGELSCAATSSSRIRITWRWTPGAGLIAYDADDYVQDGLVLHYDGIRNAGLGVPHDSAATNWVNLGSAGAAYDMTRYSLVSSAMVEGAAAGSWADNGFVFAQNAFFYESATLPVNPYYTLQTAIEATANDQNGIGYVMSPSKASNANDPLRFSIGIRDDKFTYEDVQLACSFYHNAMDATGGRPAVAVELNETVNYGTAMLDHTNGVFFTGTTPPWNATGASNGHAVKTTGSASSRTYNGLTLGGTHGETGNMLAGTLHGFRYYNRLLSDDELAWNRIVDNARYFAANVTVASTRSDVQGNEPDGEYGVSGSYTFTAPASVTVGKITYEPAGYAIQAWDDVNGRWGAATEYDGASYAYTVGVSPAKVRLLWRWTAVRGIRAAADYDVSDYIAGGLVLNFDGIRNTAAGHDSSATTWANLGSNGAASDASLSKGDDSSAWTDDGYCFDGKTKFNISNVGLKAGSSYTLQLLADVDRSAQQFTGQHNYFFSGVYNQFAVSIYGRGAPYLRCGVDLRLDTLATGERMTYFTGIMNQTGASPVAYVFKGTSPTSDTSTSDKLTTPAVSDAALGGWGGELTQYGIGTIKNFRFYDRPLSDDELAHNRDVDQARYFGELGATNVFVVAGGGAQTEAGAYKVEGEWTFTATTVVNKRNDTVPVVRYTMETLVNGEWTDKRTYDGNSYTYTEGTSPATVRLRWYGQPEGVVFVVR